MIENEIMENESEYTVSYFWKGLALFLLGVILGIILAPAKNGVSIGNNNVVTGGSSDDDDDEYDEYDEGIKF